MLHRCHYRAPCTWLMLDFDAAGALQAVHWAGDEAAASPLLAGVWADKLDAYFSGRLNSFDYPPSSRGTAFQQRVWQAIAAIPYGQVASYGDIARLIGSAPRAVGQACGRNPLPIIIPCHRVVAAQGLGGFSLGRQHDTLAIKRWLLQHEGVKL